MMLGILGVGGRGDGWFGVEGWERFYVLGFKGVKDVLKLNVG